MMTDDLLRMSGIAAQLRALGLAWPWVTLLLQALLVWLLVWVGGYFTRHWLEHLAQPFPFLRRMTRDVFPLARVAVFLVLVQVLLRNFPKAEQAVFLIRDLNSLALVATLTWLLVRAVSSARDTIVELHPVTVTNNLSARRIQTQTRVLARSAIALIVLIGAGLSLMTVPALRQIGTSMLASAGVAGLVVGFAARPIFTNLLAGLQIALTQPIRLDDVVIVEGEWGRIEEITGTYVVVKIWDQRRLILPLQWFIEHPFQNWTRHSAEILGTVSLWLDYRVPLAALRTEAQRLCDTSPLWDRRLLEVQIVDTSEHAVQVRVLISAANADHAWHLRCALREGLIAYLQQHWPASLPRLRVKPVATPPGAPDQAG